MERRGASTRSRSLLLLAGALLSALPGATMAAGESRSVDPSTIARALTEAVGGQTFVLAPGDYGTVTFPRRTFSPAVRLEADQARFSGLVLARTGGVTVSGGTVEGPGGRSYGISIREAQDVRVENMRIGGAYRGIVIDRSEDVQIVGSRLVGLISDGINVAHSHRVRLERNVCRDFSPTPATFDEAGKRLKDGDHPDCIQAWSRPQYPPTSDLTIVDNEMEGAMQGIFLGNHRRNGVDDGGFDRVIVRGNRITVSYPTGIAVMAARGGEVVGNVVRTIPGSRLPNGRRAPVRVQLRLDESDVRACGNVVEALPNGPGTRGC